MPTTNFEVAGFGHNHAAEGHAAKGDDFSTHARVAVSKPKYTYTNDGALNRIPRSRDSLIGMTFAHCQARSLNAGYEKRRHAPFAVLAPVPSARTAGVGYLSFVLFPVRV